MKCLIAKGADPSLQDNRGWNSLHFASHCGDPNVIELLLNHMPDIETRAAEGVTSLMIAAGNCKLQAVKALIKKGADPSLENNNGWNSLHCALRGGDCDVIELILNHMTDIASRTAMGCTPLMIAAANGKLPAVKCLVGKGASPSLEDNNGWNSLHWASWGGNTGIIDTLLSYGVDIESKSKFGETSLMIARGFGRTEAVTYLVSKGAKSE